MSNPQQLVQKLWNYCNILRDDGLSCGDYVEQLTFLVFLKMADEQSKPPLNKPLPFPKGFGWDALLKRDRDELESHYLKGFACDDLMKISCIPFSFA
jgi:type I restriction enzyme M protein